MDFFPSRWRRAAIDAVGQLADGVDDWWTGRQGAGPIGPAPSAGVPATLWAASKTAAALAAVPLTAGIAAVAAVQAQRTALGRIEQFDAQIHATCEDRPGPLPVRRALRLPADGRYLITSDLHRGIGGRLDWPLRQGTKDLYRHVVSSYADEGWTLLENGDVEDFWMVGGSTWGATYDVVRLATGAVGPLADDTRRDLLGNHLERIVENNQPLYDLLAEMSRGDRYRRTLGNHDDVLVDTVLADRLAHHLPGFVVPDAIVLTDLDGEAADGPSLHHVAAVVMHGHLTDAWNGPGLATLGRAATWISSGLDDLPTGGLLSGLPGEVATETLLDGRAENQLIALDVRYGGNRRFDSLDEERLFTRLVRSAPDGGWPWLIFGHTHFPMLRPVDSAGNVVRYANSGCGVLPGAFTAVEWDGSNGASPRLVIHHVEHGRPVRRELVPDGAVLAVR